MADSYRDRPAVRDEDNAFIFVMGFEVAPGESPLEMGRQRVAWMSQYEGPTEFDASTDPLGNPPDHRAAMHPALRTYLESCRPGMAACAAARAEAGRSFDEWAPAQSWLLERYRSLLALTGWRESAYTDIAAPVPPYQLVMDGQKVLLLHARDHAMKGDAAGLRELLGADLRFWRHVLASSDSLLSKMIATAAINRNFKLGAEAIGLLPPKQVPEALPAEWHVEISDTERSLRRVMCGEWAFISEMVRDMASRGWAGGLLVDDTFLARVKAWLSAPLFQPQDSINLSTPHLAQVVGLTEGVPLSGYEAAAIRVFELSLVDRSDTIPTRFAYNIVGRSLLDIGAPDYSSYPRRVGDIEGVRRAALAAIELHATKVAPDSIPAALAASPLRNPYNGKPFNWDATDGAVIFRGLEPGERGEHRIH
jgi:hypothetical protein